MNVQNNLETEEGRMAAARRLFDQLDGKTGGGGPNGPVTTLPATPRGAPVPEGVFCFDDVAAYQMAVVKHPMPGGKHVWIHQLSTESVSWLNRQAAARVAGMPDKADQGMEYRFWAHIYQVIACCKVGPEVNAALCFTADQADTLRRNLPWEVQEQIVRRCDGLGGDEEALSDGLLAFFGSAQASLRTCVSQLNTGSLDACRAGLERLATSVSRITQLKSLGSDEAASLKEP